MPEMNPQVNDDQLHALDRELSQLLAVEPSPEFAAQVRLRIQREPVRRFEWTWWVLATVGAAAAVAIVAFAASRREAVQPPASVHADVMLPAPRVNHELPAPVPEQGRVVRTRSERRAQSSQFEIVIDPALAAAIRRLATEQPHLPEVPPEPSLDPVVVELLKVPDIADAGTKQGDRQ